MQVSTSARAAAAQLDVQVNEGDVSLEEEYKQFLGLFLKSTVAERSALLESGKDLANRLSSTSISLCYSKATEFSPDIERFFFTLQKWLFWYMGKGPLRLSPSREMFFITRTSIHPAI
jgi:putative heme degradation protein